MSMIEFHNVEKYYGKFHALKTSTSQLIAERRSF